MAEKNYADEVAGVTRAVGFTTINSNGNVTQVYLTDSGAKYVITPVVTFSEPIAGIITSSGSFIFNEIITGGTSGTTARVKEYNAPNNTLEISIVDGAFVAGETITGADSGSVETPDTTYSLTVSNLTFSNGYAAPEIQKYTGDIIYVENRRTVSRAIDQIEDVKLVVEF